MVSMKISATIMQSAYERYTYSRYHTVTASIYEVLCLDQFFAWDWVML
jgi:hypothetical protein